MREILFRGKRSNGHWEYGDLLISHKPEHEGERCEAYIISYVNTNSRCNYCDKISEMDFYNVSKDTVGQYTGLTDKNGAKIFEGDIVQFINPNNTVTEICHGEVDYNGQFCGYVINYKTVYTKTEFCRLTYTLSSLEVIGSIHDNRELLTEDTKI